MPKGPQGQMSGPELLEARARIQHQIDVLGGPMKGSIHDTNRVQLLAELQSLLDSIEENIRGLETHAQGT
jgi:hypothetical protein